MQVSFLFQSWTALKADAKESRANTARSAAEADRARQAEEAAQRQISLLQEAMESLRSGDNPHLALHQLQLLHRLPLESVLSLQAQLCTCLHAVEQVLAHTQVSIETSTVCSNKLTCQTSDGEKQA